MLQNLVFDMGGVLIEFDPLHFISQEVAEPAQQQLVLRELFRSVEWAQLDRGTLDLETAMDSVCARLPAALVEPARRIFTGWYREQRLIAGMESLAQRLKASGYHLYLLSNAGVQFYQYYQNIPALQHFDQLYISADHQLLKPDPAIYHDFCRAMDLRPESCLFIDDLPINVEGAIRCGWQGVVFHGDALLLEQELCKRGIVLL